MMKTPEYTTWILTAGMMMRMGLSKCKALPVRIRVEIHSGQGFPESRDLDNCIKPIADAVRASKILPDDRVTEISKIDLEYIRRHRATGIATCWIEIEELGDCVQGELFEGSDD